ncbi:phosphate ABC transporter substrate-binding protein [Pseudoduganella plicata]|nr:phosphate ABC transporter substrate-binding protein [Pseudoduganella plicata]
MLKRTLAAVLAACAVSAAAAAEVGELVVIVSARTPLTMLRTDQAAGIFLGESYSLPDGGEAVALDQSVGSPLRDEFYRKVAHRSPALMKAYWTKMIFTGRGQPPREAPSSAAVRRLVADNPGMVGYIERAALDPTVRPVLVLK